MSGNGPEGFFDIVSLNVSEKTGTRKRPVDSITLVAGKGVAGDAHSGILENRQVSLLGIEDIETASKTACGAYREKGGVGDFALVPGDFAENITTRGVVLYELPLGTKIELGETLLEVSKIGKECHTGCEIKKLVGDCIMPRRGIFVRVLRGGEVKREDRGHYLIG
jgi:MOSC domain-containing protein YiiM